MRKKILCLVLVLIFVFSLFAGCQQTTEVPPADNDTKPVSESTPPEDGKPFFALTGVPKLSGFSGISDISSRFYRDYIDDLIPAKDYGKLYPYIGKVVGDGAEYSTRYYYGLCTEDGKIIVDPVYTSAFIPSENNYNSDGSLDIIVMYKSDFSNIDPEDEESMWEDPPSTVFVAARDGSWVVQKPDAYFYSVSEGVFTLNSYQENAFLSSVYDGNGNPIAEDHVGEIGPFHNGLAYIAIDMVTEANDTDARTLYSYVDKNLNTVIAGPFATAGDFNNGLAAVQDPDTYLYGIIDINGNYAVPPTFSELSYFSDGDYSVCTFVDGTRAVIDRTGNIVFTTQYGTENMYIQNQDPLVVEVYQFSEDTSSTQYYVTFDKNGTATEHHKGYDTSLDNGWFASDNGDGSVTVTNGSKRYIFETNSMYAISTCDAHTLYVPLYIYDYVDQNGEPPAEAVAASCKFNLAKIYNLDTGDLLFTVKDGYYNYTLPNGNYLFTDAYFMRSKIYDRSGATLGGNEYFNQFSYNDGYCAVSTPLYSGLMDNAGNWILRLSTVNSD